MDIKQKITSTSLALFMKYGVKSITMDEIAREASVSKKTIYQHFSDKNHLVFEVTKKELSEDQCFFEGLQAECENAIEEVLKIAVHIREHISQMNPSLLYDLKKYHTKAWDYYNQHKTECYERSVSNNLSRGVEEEYYRPTINVAILSRMRMMQVETALGGEAFTSTEFNIVEVHMQILEHFIMGVVTEKGLKLYNQYLSNENN